METKEEANLSWRLPGDLGESMCALEMTFFFITEAQHEACQVRLGD